MADKAANLGFPHTHLLGIEGLSRTEITALLDKSEEYVAQNRKADKKVDLLRGRTIINLFFESYKNNVYTFIIISLIYFLQLRIEKNFKNLC